MDVGWQHRQARSKCLSEHVVQFLAVIRHAAG
jgi:hypothetical protein